MTPDDQITVLCTTSPVTSHPSTGLIEQAVTSLRSQLPTARIVILADGVPRNASHLADAYAGYLTALHALADGEWSGVEVLAFGRHRHQASMVHAALKAVDTPVVLFWEHDWIFRPQRDPVPWDALCAALTSGDADQVRLSWEHRIEPAHLSMYTLPPEQVHGVPMVRTQMWSSRPHLVRTGYYRQHMRTLGPSRTFIEDIMSGVVSHEWHEHPERAWDSHRLWLYHPEGADISIIDHLDGRQGAPLSDVLYEYDGNRPAGAPARTVRRR